MYISRISMYINTTKTDILGIIQFALIHFDACYYMQYDEEE